MAKILQVNPELGQIPFRSRPALILACRQRPGYHFRGRGLSPLRFGSCFYLFGLLLWLLVGGLSRPAAAVTPEEVVNQVQKRYEATQAFKAGFRQEARLKSGGGEERASGELFFQKPSRMRWDYQDRKPRKNR